MGIRAETGKAVRMGVLLAVAALAVSISPGAAAARAGKEGASSELSGGGYTVTDLGTFGGELANAFGINELGEVVGRAEHPDTAVEAFLWRDGDLIGLGSLVESGLGSTGFAINNNSEVVGDTPAPDPQFPGSTWVPFYWSETTGMINIGDDFTYSGTGQTRGINDHGVAVGRWRSRAFTWSLQDGYDELELLPGAFFQQSEAMAINDDGLVVGSSNDPQGFTKPVRWHPDGTIEQLPTLGGNYGVANEVNIHGEVAGEAQRSTGHTRPVLWMPDGSVLEIPLLEEDPPINAGYAEGINDHGVSVGWDWSTLPGDGRQVGWVYHPDGTKLRLNDLIDPAADWDIRIPLDINNQGQIVGIGIHTIDGVPYAGRAFLLTPADAVEITLSATGRKVRGKHTADLSWEGTTSADVDVYRDGALIATVPDTGFHTDSIGAKGRAAYVYQVCEAGTSTCSNEATVRFGGSAS